MAGATKRNQSGSDENRALYLLQNKIIHQARAQLGMELDDCRELAMKIGRKASISSLTLRQRWELIEILKTKGANVYNPNLTGDRSPSKGRYDVPSSEEQNMPLIMANSGYSKANENPKDLFPQRFAYWNNRFPRSRPGFASNRQLAWLETIWILDFDDQRTDWRSGLRGFLFRQTRISDLAFLRADQLQALMTPLVNKAKERHRLKRDVKQERATHK